MSEQRLLERLVELLNAVQQRINQDPVAITHDTIPLREIPQFDSLVALEISVELEAEFGCLSEENLFYDDATRKPLRVKQIAARLDARLRTRELSNA